MKVSKNVVIFIVSFIIMLVTEPFAGTSSPLNIVFIVSGIVAICLMIYGIGRLFYATKEGMKKTAFNITGAGRNRTELINELYSFIQAHGGVHYVVINSQGVIVYGQNNQEYKYGYGIHQFESLKNDAMKDIAGRLAKRFKCCQVYKTHIEQDRGNGIADDIALAVGAPITGHGDITVLDCIVLMDDANYQKWQKEKEANKRKLLKRVN